MIDKLAHALLPLAVIVAATVMACLHVIESATAVALIGGAAGIGAITVAKA